MTDPQIVPVSRADLSFSRRHVFAEFLLCIILVTAFGIGSLYMLHREQESHAPIAETALRAGSLDAAGQQRHLRSERDLRIMLAATSVLSLALIIAVYWRMDRLCSLLMRARDEAQHQAHHDDLTGLPNARLLTDRLAMALAHARRVKQTVAVVAVDLEGFRQINEAHGPIVGDDILKQAARRMQMLSRDADTVARMRDDEFVMVLSDVKSSSAAAAFAQRLITNLSATYTVDGARVSVGARVGLSLFSGQATCADDLVRAANEALWKAKEGSESRVQVA